MSHLYSSAQEWAQEHSKSADVRFSQLEILAFQRHPEIYALFGEDGARVAQRHSAPQQSPLRRVGTGLLVVLGIIGMIAPIAGMTVMGGDRFNFFRMDGAVSIPIAGVCFAITAVMLLAVGVSWLRMGAPWSGFILGVFILGALASMFGLIAMPNTAAIDAVTGWQIWRIPVVVSMILAVVGAAAVAARFRVRIEPEEPDARVSQPATMSDLSAVRAAVGALPVDEREAIVRDRDAALSALYSRGLVDETLLARARAHELGMLYTLDQ